MVYFALKNNTDDNTEIGLLPGLYTIAGINVTLQKHKKQCGLLLSLYKSGLSDVCPSAGHNSEPYKNG